MHCTVFRKDDADFEIHAHTPSWRWVLGAVFRPLRNRYKVFVINLTRTAFHEIPQPVLNDHLEIFKERHYMDVVAMIRALNGT
jgi:hypothetical protein